MAGEMQAPYLDDAERAQFRVDGYDQNSGERIYQPDPGQPEFDLKVPEKPEFDKETQEIFEEIRRGDFTNTEKLTKLTPEIAKLVAQSGGRDMGFLDMDPDEVNKKEAKAVITGNAVMMQEEAGEYNTGRVLDLDGIVMLRDPLVAKELIQFKGAIKMDGLQGGSQEALEILLKHKGPLLVRNLAATGILNDPEDLRALNALANRSYFTPVRDPILSEHIQAYRTEKHNPQRLEAEVSSAHPDPVATLEEVMREQQK